MQILTENRNDCKMIGFPVELPQSQLEILLESQVEIEHRVSPVDQREVPVAVHEQRRCPLLIQPKV